MRLSEGEVSIIKTTIRTFDPSARVILFGSRTDNSQKGGDIDLFIISNKISGKEKRNIRIALEDNLGEQKIDILIEPEPKTPFARIAMREGIEL